MSKLPLQSDISDVYCIWDDPFDPVYRYVLYRDWNKDEVLPHAVFIGLNPSVADEKNDDRTVRRCINFARREGCGSMSMLNAFALISTDSKKLFLGDDPIGKDNYHYIVSECESASIIVIAWGTNGKHLNQHEKLLNLLKKRKLFCFGKNLDGTPKHPLYLSNNVKLVEFEV